MGGVNKVKIIGDEELRRKLNQLGQKAQSALRDAAYAGGDVIKDEANINGPGPHNEIGREKLDGGKCEVSIGPDEDHWYYQFAETGATPHEIRPVKKRKKKALAFLGDAGWKVVQAVKHPGITAAPFLRPAIKTKKEEARKAAGRVFKREIDKLVE